MISPNQTLSLKGRTPQTTDSKDTQYLYSILQSINNLASVLSSSSGKTTMLQSTATGDTTVTIPANTWVTSIAAKSAGASETINIGTTPGGTDIASGLSINNTGFTSVAVNKFYSQDQIIYITGATGSVTYNVLTSVN